MLQYRLLRNNKETGPYTKEQLIAMGLKAYDLIWADGKSAAWNYPSEMEEFKAFAPVAEEQSFDRFFKKENNNISVINQPNFEQSFSQTTTIKQEKPRIKIKADWRKVEQPVFVSQTNNPVEKTNFEPLQKTVSQTTSRQNTWTNWEQEKKSVASSSSNEKKVISSSPKNVINDVQVETKYSQSLDDIKERYVETVLKPKQRKSISLKKYILPAILFPLLGFGMWVGFTQNTDTNNLEKKQVTPHQTVTIPQTVDPQNSNADNNNASANDQTEPSNVDQTQPVETNKPVANDVNEISKNNTPDKSIINNKIISPPTANKVNDNLKKKAVIPANSKQNISANDNPVAENNSSDINNNPVVADPPARTNTVSQNGQQVRTAARRDDNNMANNSSDNNPVNTNNSVVNNSPIINPPANISAPAKKKINDFVVVNNGNQNMHLSLQNVADFPLDLTVLDIQYFDGAGHFQKGETVYVKNIPPSETVDIKVPDSKNTAKIRYKVSLISAEKKNLYMIAD